MTRKRLGNAAVGVTEAETPHDPRGRSSSRCGCDACMIWGRKPERDDLDDIPFDLDVPALLKKLRIEGKPGFEARCTRLAREAVRLARPKAAYRLASVEAKGKEPSWRMALR